MRCPVRWEEVAVIRGTVAHRQMQWPQVWALPTFDDPVIEACVEAGLAPITPPDEGTLPPEVAYPLVELLGERTGVSRWCFVGVWRGFACEYQEGIPETKRVSSKDREWDLFRAPLEALAMNFFNDGARFRQSPNMAWPDDRRWFLITDIDLSSTYVGGTEALIGQILRHDSLEAHEAFPHDSCWQDTENPPPSERRYRLGLIVDDDRTIFMPFRTRVASRLRRIFLRWSGRKVLVGGRIIRRS